MLLKKWEQLPEQMQRDEVRPYYDALQSKKVSLVCKRLFDIIVSDWEVKVYGLDNRYTKSP